MADELRWLIYAGITIALLAAFFAGMRYGRRSEAMDAAERKRREGLHRANQLRERGRVQDVRPDATGAPAVVRDVRVLGKSPRSKPPTRM